MLRKNGIESLSYSTLGSSKALADRVGAIAQKCQNALSSQLRKTRQIKGISEYRSVIYFKVSGVHNDTGRSKQSQRCGIRNTVVGLNELYTEAAQVYRLAVFYHFTLGALH